MAEQQGTPHSVQPLAAVAATRPPVKLPRELVHHGTMENFKTWLVEEGPWWLCSFVFHMVLFLGLALFATIFAPSIVKKLAEETAPEFEEAKVEPKIEEKKIEKFELADAPVEPTTLDPMQLDLKPPAQTAQDEKYDDNEVFKNAGGGVKSENNQPNLGGLSASIKGLGPGPAIEGLGGLTNGAGTGKTPGGSGSGFGGRGQGHRKAMLGRDGPTQQSERSVAAALNWLARHQNSDGSWSLKKFSQHCGGGGGVCDGVGTQDRVSAATALALLPFLASGTTPDTPGATYRATVTKGIEYLIQNQKPDGDLRININESNLYDHGLAAIALCECYGMSPNGKFGKVIRSAAQAALNFIMAAQDPVGGGWRYAPRQPGDTSVVGWQLMALKSGRMANLTVNEAVFAKAVKFLDSVCYGGKCGGLYVYTPGGHLGSANNLAVTSVGLLCRQYMGMARTDPAMVEGTTFLMNNLPKINNRNTYYWYYAMQVMHNQPGPEWDSWNRKMRRLLIESQCQDSDDCASGSWSPGKVAGKNIKDVYGDVGGRVMMTSLSALTLEVYYRYLPLYKLDKELSGTPVVAEAANGEKKSAQAETKTKK